MATESYQNAGYPGIAASTGTRVDSASKHIMACKVDGELLGSWCLDPASREVLHSNKMRYCMHRDELVLNCGQALNETSVYTKQGHAYPAVVTTLGDMLPGSKKLLRDLYHRSLTGRQWFIEKEKLADQHHVFKMADDCKCDKQQLWVQARSMPFFVAQGYALGTAYGSQLSGDTVASVQVGGMFTVMNGHFECRAGQMLQWYFDFEAPNWSSRVEKMGNHMIPAGTRRAEAQELTTMLDDADESTKLRKKFNDRQFGNPNSYGEVGAGTGGVKTNVFFPKPYQLRADGSDHFGDKIRIFAKCINGARPHEMMDIMMMTQSL